MTCMLNQNPPAKPSKECNKEEYQLMYNSMFEKCGDGCDCCFFACNGGLGCCDDGEKE